MLLIYPIKWRVALKNIGVILAAGNGVRSTLGIPKQFIKLSGKTLVEHVLDVFQSSPHIDEIAVVTNSNCMLKMEEIVSCGKYPKVKKLLLGGKERWQSTASAVDAYAGVEDPNNTNILIHDSVRPLVSLKIIEDVIKALQNNVAVDVAVPSPDTVIEVNKENMLLRAIPDRTTVYRGQTPQAFRLSILQQAYSLCKKAVNVDTTCDCSTVRRFLPHIDIFVVNGEQTNIKLTYREDIFLIDKLFQVRATTGHNDQELETQQLKDKVMVVFGGNSGIGKAIKDSAAKYGSKVYSFSRSENSIDITDPELVKRSLQGVYDREGRIDYVVNTAAVLKRGSLDNMSFDEISELTRINFNGAVNVTKCSFDYLKQSKGHLLLYTSSSYTRGRATYSIYSSLKSAIVNFCQAISDEWSPYGVRINCINPERTKTPMRTRNFGVEDDATLLSVDVVAKHSLMVLLSKFTGQVINVNRYELADQRGASYDRQDVSCG